MPGYTALLGNRLARPGRIVLGQAPPASSTPRAPDFLPALLVEWSPTTGPMGAAVWADITNAVMSFTCARGRQTETDKVEAGTCTLQLANDDRRFDPMNTSGPYYGQLVPRKRIRIQANWAGVWYPVWMGYVEKWNPSLWRYGKMVCPVTATDGFGLLALKKLSTSYPQQLTSERIRAVLTDAGWSTGQGWILGDAVYGVLGTTTIPAPVGDTAISAGQTTVQAVTLTNISALAEIQLMAQTEQGMAYVGPDGSVTFRNRNQRLYPGSVSATFGTNPSAGELPYADADIDATGARIFNEVKITAIGGVEQVATDAASVAAYFGRTFSLSALPLLTDQEALSYASFLLSRTKDFHVRLTDLTIDPPADPDNLWPQVLARRLTDQVRVIYRPDVGSTMNELVLIERVTHVFNAENATWLTTWALSPANIDTTWILEDPVYGLLGTTTIPAY